MTPITQCIEIKDKKLAKLLNSTGFKNVSAFLGASTQVEPTAKVKGSNAKVEYFDPFSENPIAYFDSTGLAFTTLDNVIYLKDIPIENIVAISNNEKLGQGGVKWQSYFATVSQDVEEGKSVLKDSKVNAAQRSMIDELKKGDYIPIVLQDGADIGKDGTYIGDYGQVIVIIRRDKYKKGMTRKQVLRSAFKVDKQVYGFSMHSGKEEDSFFNEDYKQRLSINAKKTGRTQAEVDAQFRRERDELNSIRDRVKDGKTVVPLELLKISNGLYKPNRKSITDLKSMEMGSQFSLERVRVVSEFNKDKNPDFEIGDTIMKINGVYFKAAPFSIDGVNERVISLYGKDATEQDSNFLDFILKNQRVGQEYIYYKVVDGKYKFEYRPFSKNGAADVVVVTSKQELTDIMNNPFRQTFNITIDMIQKYNEDIASLTPNHKAYLPAKNGKYEVLDIQTFLEDYLVPERIFYNRKTEDGLQIETNPINRYFYFKPAGEDMKSDSEELPTINEPENFENPC